MKNIGFSLRQSIFSINFLVSLVVGTGMLFAPIMKELFAFASVADCIYFFETAQNRAVFCIFVPLLATLPHTARFCDEVNSGYIKSILVREKTITFLVKKLVTNGVSGGLAVCLPTLLLAVASIVFGIPYRVEDIHPGFQTHFQNTILENMQFIWGGGLVLTVFVVLAFLSGTVWANVGLCISAFIQNKYFAVGFPLVLYYGITVILVGSNFFGFSPMNLLFPTAINSVSIYTNILFQIFEFIAIGVIFVFRGRVALKNV